MTEGQLRLGVGLLIAVAIIGALLRFLPDSASNSDGAPLGDVWSVEPEHVRRIEIQRKTDKVVLERDGNTWQVREPYVDIADPWTVNELVKNLAELKTGIHLEEVNPDTLGVGTTPEAVIHIIRENGSDDLLTVGLPTAVGGRLYVRTKSGEYLAVKSSLYKTLVADAVQFRDRRLWTFDPSQVKQVVLQGPDGILTIERSDTANIWQVLEFGPADPDRIEDLLTGLLDLRLESWIGVNSMPNLPTVERSAVVRLVNGQQLELRVGVAQGKFSPIEVVDGPRGQVLSDVLALLGQGPSDIVEPRAFPVDFSIATQIQINLDGTRFHIERASADAVWMRDGKEQPITPAVIEALSAANVVFRPPPMTIPKSEWSMIQIHIGDVERIFEVSPVDMQGDRIVREVGGQPYRVPASAFEQILVAIGKA